ncbi:SOSS complex subunit B1,SOSS complex subunit B homolog,SOSS complex subunit B1-B,SOSS complex subunit B1-A,SOSS complex subunit B2 [Mytilus coruscus]|uniref:SOSS complex subunit B1,SOSS complex subunit B homolog,SOSS complex subunit B1-B,SOSS complex subunit B1-A,SOSS complex subunit B2 n=1 Tax=Mytilus coruscus TaxID=42192 RepID=A0A6J8BP21_MYTCO|nr:SOSS complex subunit B1,SOSS complex subunit B homolog,SOSS complex subunit B1-B,SOSS complex subunit B1-A,SOSS complex subunit B2 [Mytilus coruscus]
MTEPQYMPIKEVRPSQKNINVMFIVLEIGKPTRTKDGHDVRSVKVADKSGSINISIWDEAGDLLQTGDICKLTKGYSNVWKNCLTLYTGKIGEITKIGEFCLQFSEQPNMSEPNPDLVKNEPPTQRKSPTEGSDAKNQQGNASQNPPIQTSNRPPLMGTPPGGMNFQNTRPQDPRMAPHDPRLMNPQHNRGGGPSHGIRPMNGQAGRGMPRR